MVMNDIEAGELTALIPRPSEAVAVNGREGTKDIHSSEVVHDEDVAELILHMFMANFQYSADLSRYPKTNPKLPPVVRCKRHRNFYIFGINQFRHWWKTSR
jgi:hypothetical protein